MDTTNPFSSGTEISHESRCYFYLLFIMIEKKLSTEMGHKTCIYFFSCKIWIFSISGDQKYANYSNCKFFQIEIKWLVISTTLQMRRTSNWCPIISTLIEKLWSAQSTAQFKWNGVNCKSIIFYNNSTKFVDFFFFFIFIFWSIMIVSMASPLSIHLYYL